MITKLKECAEQLGRLIPDAIAEVATSLHGAGTPEPPPPNANPRTLLWGSGESSKIALDELEDRIAMRRVYIREIRLLGMALVAATDGALLEPKPSMPPQMTPEQRGSYQDFWARMATRFDRGVPK